MLDEVSNDSCAEEQIRPMQDYIAQIRRDHELIIKESSSVHEHATPLNPAHIEQSCTGSHFFNQPCIVNEKGIFVLGKNKISTQIAAPHDIATYNMSHLISTAVFYNMAIIHYYLQRHESSLELLDMALHSAPRQHNSASLILMIENNIEAIEKMFERDLEISDLLEGRGSHAAAA